MADTFAYDLVSFLRVIYRRRWFIVKGTVGVTFLVVVASLIWPETWRANARILVSTPKYKESLRLVPKQFDVLTYQSIMSSDRNYQEIIATLKFYRESVQKLHSDQAYRVRITSHLQVQPNELTPFELIQRTNLGILTEFLVPEKNKDDQEWANRIQWLGNLSQEELQAAYELDEDALDDLSVFDLRKMLKPSVSKVKETNLETVYSNLIQVSAEFDTAPGAKMVTNTWLDIFMVRAEEIVRRNITKQIDHVQRRAAAFEIELVSAETRLTEFKNASNLENLRADAASKLVLLTGLTPTRQLADRMDESFSLDNEDPTFMKERYESTDTLSFTITPQFDNALLRLRSDMMQEIAYLKTAASAEGGIDPEAKKQYQNKLVDREAELKSVNERIREVTAALSTTLKTIRNAESKMAGLERHVSRVSSSLNSLRPLLDEASLLESRSDDTRYADVGYDSAIQPDKRVFPKRSLMSLAGMILSFVLFIGLAFFMDIWSEVTRPEDETV